MTLRLVREDESAVAPRIDDFCKTCRNKGCKSCLDSDELKLRRLIDKSRKSRMQRCKQCNASVPAHKLRRGKCRRSCQDDRRVKTRKVNHYGLRARECGACELPHRDPDLEHGALCTYCVIDLICRFGPQVVLRAYQGKSLFQLVDDR